MSKLVSRWTQEETEQLNGLVMRFKKNFKRVAEHFPARSYNQIRSHYYNEVYRSERDSSKDSQSNSTPKFQAATFPARFSFYLLQSCSGDFNPLKQLRFTNMKYPLNLIQVLYEQYTGFLGISVFQLAQMFSKFQLLSAKKS
ncbi:SANT/Myb_domain [Hexamita inflata]|uniref:SANT/Myb domain n=1 Tax=Hexamita inflata TaxID=28002 RepID=A0AA86PWK2_9EUKA|nr:SANT/Myb domain [Hexamita inflata]